MKGSPMRISNTLKTIVLGNTHLIEYCNSTGIDISKLKSCNIERMDNLLVFALEKENKPKSTQIIPLDVDLATQPDPVLQIEVNGDKLNFHTTDKTSRILKRFN